MNYIYVLHYIYELHYTYIYIYIYYIYIIYINSTTRHLKYSYVSILTNPLWIEDL